ncbi:MAG: DNA ligase D [Gammaproteobacteria bacterium]|nr:MAG: DNA ligase D [Gammaproteobacteria bacterium]
MTKALSEYNRKRNFKLTSEPSGDTKSKRGKDSAHALTFVIQKHDARRLHYDFRLELDGTLKSWAIPKGPSLDPNDKRLAVHVEDHPISYAEFEGSIPHGQYGGGDVIVWDRGVWEPHGDPAQAYKSGKLKFNLIGEKLTGAWALVRTHLRASGDKEQWLLIKERDEIARPSAEYDIVSEQPQSVLTGAELKLKSPTKTKSANVTKTQKISKASAKPPKGKAPKGKATEEKLLEEKVLQKEVVEKKAFGKKSNAMDSKTSFDISSAKKSVVPQELSPELATLVSEPPSGDWLYEIKYDGYRILTRIKNGEVSMLTRNAHDWTDKLPVQAKAIADLGLDDCWLDGEVVVLNDAGLPDFQGLQNAFDIGKSHHIIYYLFDAPFLQGVDLRNQPIETRRALLEKIIPSKAKTPIRLSVAFDLDHSNVLASACAMSLEGIIGKRAGSPYVSRRSGDWIKLKCKLRQEFVIVGYTSPQGARSGFGALLIGVHEKMGSSKLLYAGRIGTGFDEKKLQDIYKKLKKLEREDSPLSHKLNSSQMRRVHWVEPTLVCEAEFAQWTGEGVLRQAVFVSLRTDKPARDITREQARSPQDLPPPEISPMQTSKAPSKTAASKKSVVPKNSASGDSELSEENKPVKPKKDAPEQEPVSKITITHPDRIIDPDSQSTKKDLAVFYGEISNWILPHLDNRAVSILRLPEGIGGEQFFQKHTEHLAIPNIKHLDKSLDPGHAALMEIDSTQALVGAVQMGTIELHTWGSKVEKIEIPDRITLDLDPDPALPWRSVVEATRLILALLDELKLDAFVKTTGGKGMHVVIPIKPDADWDQVKEFSKAISTFMERQIPERFVSKMGPKNRVGKIFIDYLRNQRGASTVSAFSVRARPGLPVSVPITRDELLKITASSQWTIANLHERLEKLKTDPWSDYKCRKGITQAMWKKLQ